MKKYKVIGKLNVELLPTKGHWWKYFFESKQWLLLTNIDFFDGEVWTTVKAQFKFDFASIPKPLKRFFPDNAIFGFGPLKHDWDYQFGSVSFSKANLDLYHNQVQIDNVPKFWAGLIWLGVTLFGWIIYNNYTKQNDLKR